MSKNSKKFKQNVLSIFVKFDNLCKKLSHLLITRTTCPDKKEYFLLSILSFDIINPLQQKTENRHHHHADSEQSRVFEALVLMFNFTTYPSPPWMEHQIGFSYFPCNAKKLYLSLYTYPHIFLSLLIFCTSWNYSCPHIVIKLFDGDICKYDVPSVIINLMVIIILRKNNNG